MRRAALAAAAALALAGAAHGAAGHGIGYELLPEARLGGLTVALEVTSSQYEDPDNPDREVRLALIDAATGVTVRDASFHVAASKGGEELFEGGFPARDGTLVFVLEGTESGAVELGTVSRGGFFESVVGLGEEAVLASGAPFRTGGLYRLAVTAGAAGEPGASVHYDVGLSIPDRTSHTVDDPLFGPQVVGSISYYDEVSGVAYDPAAREVSFRMPFDWGEANVNETHVVHQELELGRGFGGMLAARYDASVNGAPLPARAVTIDDFSGEGRTVHVVLSQADLREISRAQGPGADGMLFALAAAEGAPASAATENGQYVVAASWEPEVLRPGAEAGFLLNVTDVFLRGRQVAVPYDASLVAGGAAVARASGETAGPGGGPAAFSLRVPEGASGPAWLVVENLGGSRLARAELPVAVGPAASVPGWLRQAAGWWAGGLISDAEFAAGVAYLAERGVAYAPHAGGAYDAGRAREDAGRWAAGLIPDAEFAAAVAPLMRGAGT